MRSDSIVGVSVLFMLCVTSPSLKRADIFSLISNYTTFFYWRIINMQCSINLRCTIQWFKYYIYHPMLPFSVAGNCSLPGPFLRFVEDFSMWIFVISMPVSIIFIGDFNILVKTHPPCDFIVPWPSSSLASFSPSYSSWPLPHPQLHPWPNYHGQQCCSSNFLYSVL